MLFAKTLIHELPDFCDGIPYQIKKMAVKEAFDSLFKNIKKIKKLGGSFSLKFKSRKSPVQSCYIPKSAVKESGIYPRISGKGIRYSEKLPEMVLDSRLVLQSGRWYLTIPTKETIRRSDNQGRIVAVDPGIRSFITFFAEDSFGHIGFHDFGRIIRLGHYLDDLISRRSNVSGQRKRNMKKAEMRMRWKIRDLIDELHHKTAKFLVDNFDVICLPTFETSKMANKKSRKLRSGSVRMMMTYAFYRFSKFLEHKCFETGKQLIRVSEAYSSKLNSFTGEIMNNLGSKEYFNFDGIRINRDINGARNILCFVLTDTSSVSRNTAIVNNC